MCGICGIVNRDQADRPQPELLRRMADTIRHRGPDDEGVEVIGAAGLAHRRLSIIDLSPAGRQPMPNEDGTVWITYNGEVYNFQELRAGLKGNHTFRSRSDSEVLIHLYEEHGEQMVEQLDGMFAFALVDTRRKLVLLARDPFGIKPLYYALDGKRLVFGSEIKPILASGLVDRTLDSAALNDYFDFHWIPAPRSIFRSIRKLPPAHMLVLELDTWRHRTIRYWKPEYRPEPRTSLDDWAQEVEAELAASVRSQLVSDVPLGAFLSGGIDSSLVSFEAARASSEPLRTFTIDFSESAFSEATYARKVAEQLNTQAVFRTLPHESLDQLPALAEFYDEPFADSSLLPTNAVSRVAREHVTVVLSGDGGDELFSGYRHHVQSRQLSRLDVIPQPLNRLLFGSLARLAPIHTRVHDWGRRFALPPDERRMSVLRLPGRRLRATVLQPASRESGDARRWHVEQSLPELRDLPPVTQIQLYDLLFYLPNDMLVKVDRASMAHSLETRVPFLSRRVAELAFRIPESVRFDDTTEKRVLRRMVARHFGDELAYRAKKGFGVPLQSWMRTKARDDATRRRILDGPALREGVLDRRGVTRLLDDVAAGRGGLRTDRGDELFALLVFDAWWNRYVA